MEMKLKKLTLAFMSLGIVAGCNDSSSDSVQQVSDTELSVQAMDGYLRNALVWLDVNENYTFDEGEPNAKTIALGKATIDLSGFNGNPTDYSLMTQVIKGETIDEDNPEITLTTGYMMMAPKGYSQISPITTMLSLKIAQGATEEEALTQIREELAIPDLDPKQNYIADEITVVANSAKALSQILPKDLADNSTSIAEELEKLVSGAKSLGEKISAGDDLNNQSLRVDINGKVIVESDNDSDGVADSDDVFPDDPKESKDFDADGIGDHKDTDDDNDGWSDKDEKRLNTDAYDAEDMPPESAKDKDKDKSPDLDRDNIADDNDTDIDGDGYENPVDAFPRDKFEYLDTNGDGIGDFTSNDDDGDGITDSLDPEPKKAADKSTPVDPETPRYTETVVYYKRSDNTYTDWGLHIWNNDVCNSISDAGLEGVTWDKPLAPVAIDATYGAKFEIDLKEAHGSCMNFIVHKGNDKGLGDGDLKLDLSKGNTIYTFDGESRFSYTAVTELPPLPKGEVTLNGASAHWLELNKIAWSEAVEATVYELWAKADGGGNIKVPEAFESIALTLDGETNNPEFPHLTGRAELILDVTVEKAKALLKKQLVVVAKDDEGNVLEATKLQIPGVIDVIYTANEADADEAQLGSWVDGDKAMFALWAPTAKEVELYLYNADKSSRFESPVAMTEDPITGVWTYEGSSELENVFYRYRVNAYHPKTGNIEWMSSTDPYSLSLSTSSQYSQLVNLNAIETKPAGWDTQTIAEIAAPEDNIIYEVHIRDFSQNDAKGNESYDGKYLAFTEDERDSVTHLKSLKEAGLTTVHLLPSYDLASVDEDTTKRIEIDNTVAQLCTVNPKASLCSNEVSRGVTIRSLLDNADPATGEAQEIMADIRPLDGFNWGYDPYHYSAPEGSYAVESDGVSRIKEYRQMIMKLHDMGFRVVQDVVYNHTFSSGLYDKSVLDKTVPGYYHRLDPETGNVANSTCCDNTASENRMFEKLVEDSVAMWAEQYKIDGFRFDLMGHLMKSSMEKIYAKAKAVDPDNWFYGEGWNFGEVQDGVRGENATQWPMAGTGIGTYNDRLRDGVRGGSDTARDNPGFANAGNRFSAKVKSNMDLIRYGMAGNLQEYPLTTSSGSTVSGKEFKYGGHGAGYTKDPQESINYVSKHDNQTLWDINQYKAEDSVTSGDRARMQIVGLAPVMLGQGVPFLHMGSELLRSKSMERDSYDSGDWYNKVDFSKQTNNWNVGLPRADKDKGNWETIKSIISNPNTIAKPTDIEWTDARFKELLKIRSTTPLLKLTSEKDIVDRVKFLNSGAASVAGVIVMSVDDGTKAGTDLDSNYDAMVVAINGHSQQQSVSVEGVTGFELHPVHASSDDVKLKLATFSEGKFTLPGLTAAVFVQKQVGAQGAGLSKLTTNIIEGDVPTYGETALLVRGDMNSWGTTDSMAYTGNGTYQLLLNLEAKTYTFKLADADWGSVNFGYDQVTIADGSMALTNTNGNIQLVVTQPGTYKITVDASGNKSKPVLIINPTYACYQGEGIGCDLRIYQVMVESFVNGDDTINYEQGYGSSHHKGDLQGVIDSLDYIRSLNVNAVWLTPVFNSCKGASGDVKLDATGYFACDFFNVDPNFGTNEKLKELIDTAHTKGMYVFLDGVFGHTNLTSIAPSPTGLTPTLKEGESGYPGQLVVYPDTGSEAFFTEVATYWIKEYKIDGWRLDQAYQVPVATWANIRTAIETAAKANKMAGEAWGTLGYMVGETWKGADEIASTTYGANGSPGLLSAFNFPLRYGVVQALAVDESGASGNATKLNADWNAMEKYPFHALPNLMLGNHDLVRFGDLIQRGNLSDAALRHKAAFSFLTAYSGPITFYYGDEIGDELAGFSAKVTESCVDVGQCDDHVSRTSGKIEGVVDSVTLDDKQKGIKSWLAKAMQIRADNPALYKGNRINLLTSENIYADLKVYNDQQIVYILNVSTNAAEFDLDMSLVKDATELVNLMTDEKISVDDNKTTLVIPALSGLLFKLN
ncbi:pullulanase-type alpha-1,6-glucosidase [Vibrio sp. DW001]|uniref:pullulanase-type alpha-1,6-glucosidase n=1 Tax=Vibrio sp. DW001 TaxID=2912315 RepID=UPI0023B1B9E0|nr:pullulanase-type alpha-1,6-glucosidase [Vibrio sp. DW001]WED29969.1 pullulanase-type alpha-1,6-glucosidase [Vibrio sp. DW001]